jgi:hypothetical protein
VITKGPNQHSLHFPLKKVETLLEIGTRRTSRSGPIFLGGGGTKGFVGRWIEEIRGQTDCRSREVAVSSLLG